MELNEYQIINIYKDTAMRMLRLAFPRLSDNELNTALDYSIIKRCKNGEAVVTNNYKNAKVDSTVLDMCEFILSREPIVTSRGVLFARHNSGVPNPITKLLKDFMDNRGVMKNKMFEYPKGSELFERYNLLQLLEKLNANALYGAMGNKSCLYFNLNAAASITTQGRSAISAAGLQFEMFMNNNVDFASLTEIITFIDNIRCETRIYKDEDFLDRNITLDECFYKVMYTCGFSYVPTNKDMDIVWDILSQCSQQDLNRIYYKNNLFNFFNNSSMNNMIIYILSLLDTPYVDPNHVPISIKVELQEMINVLKEFVYYHHQIIDRIGKFSTMIRSIVATTDTDSCIISLDGWYRFILDKVKDVDLNVKHFTGDIVNFIEADEFGDRPLKKIVKFEKYVDDYDFINDEVIELEKQVDPFKLIPQDSLRYSIINIMAYALTEIVNDYMKKYCATFNTMDETKPYCLLYLKNEFLFSRALLTEGKKNYASIQELQEGNIVGSKLDIKGLPMSKSGVNETTQKRLKEIVYEDILKTPTVDLVKIIKKLAIFEKDIIKSLRDGEKTFYKPARIKAMNSYEDPLRVFGIKGCIVWNETKEDGIEGIDLEARNSIDVLKVNINLSNVNDLKETNEEVYNKLMGILNRTEFKGIIEYISIPKNATIPEWVKDFINYQAIVNDNLSNAPIEYIGLYRGNKNVNYTNIISI